MTLYYSLLQTNENVELLCIHITVYCTVVLVLTVLVVIVCCRNTRFKRKHHETLITITQSYTMASLENVFKTTAQTGALNLPKKMLILVLT